MPSTFSGLLVTDFQHCRKFSLRKCGKSEYVCAWENVKRAEDRHFLRYREYTPRERVSGRRAREFRLHISLAFANHGVLPLSKQRARARGSPCRPPVTSSASHRTCGESFLRMEEVEDRSHLGRFCHSRSVRMQNPTYRALMISDAFPLNLR